MLTLPKIIASNLLGNDGVLVVINPGDELTGQLSAVSCHKPIQISMMTKHLTLKWQRTSGLSRSYLIDIKGSWSIPATHHDIAYTSRPSNRRCTPGHRFKWAPQKVVIKCDKHGNRPINWGVLNPGRPHDPELQTWLMAGRRSDLGSKGWGKGKWVGEQTTCFYHEEYKGVLWMFPSTSFNF